MVNFISHPVITGFISSVSITVSAGQLPKVFGIHTTTHKFFPGLLQLFNNLKNTNIYDFIVGVISMMLIKLMKYVKNKYADKPDLHKYLQRSSWLIGTARLVWALSSQSVSN